MKAAVTALLLLLPRAALAAPAARLAGPTPSEPWEHWVVARDGKPSVDTYALRDATKKPVVVFFAGSHCVPLFFYRMKDGKRRDGSTNPFQDLVETEARSYHFVAVERRGLHSFVEFSTGDLDDHCTKTHGSVSKEDRVEDGADVVRALAAQPWAGDILVAGHSEGADVASGVARALGDGPIRAVAILAGGGPSQFFEHVMEERREGRDAEAQTVFDELLSMTSATPPATYRGHPFERYASFALRSTPLDDLRGLAVPVFIAHGTRDHNAAIEGADVLAVELLRTDPKRAVHYLVLGGCDHGFYAADGGDHRKEVLDGFVTWASAPTRGVETHVYAAAPRNEHIEVRYFGVQAAKWRLIAIAALPLLAFIMIVVLARRARRR